MNIIDAAVVTLVLIGSVFMLIAGVGIVRMPDLYTRMQSATKAGTLGVASIVLAVALHFGTAPVVLEAALIILFLFATAPVASHLIARAAYGVGVPLWKQTWRDDLSSSHDSEGAHAVEDAERAASGSGRSERGAGHQARGTGH